jgi:hypothetical protein
MKVTHYKDAAGNWFKEIVDTKHSSLKAMQGQYQAKGFKTWLNLYDNSPKWMLTVCTGKVR